MTRIEGDYLFQLNVHFLMESFLLLAQHVSDLTEPIIRSTIVVLGSHMFSVCFVLFLASHSESNSDRETVMWQNTNTRRKE
jgi:hypothetical protein